MERFRHVTCLKDVGPQSMDVIMALAQIWAVDADNMIAPTIAFELALAKPKHYLDLFDDKFLFKMKKQYRVLLDRISKELDHRSRNVVLCLERLQRDWDYVVEKDWFLSTAKESEHYQHKVSIISVTELAADPHEGGQRALLLEFERDGRCRHIVYKPRGGACWSFLKEFCHTAEIYDLSPRGLKPSQVIE